jgi:UDP-N-acetylmuramoyl-tripeptide--D-alanyl-D-alanine ligase
LKKVQLNIEDIFNVPGSVIYNPDNLKKINYVSIDSRNIGPNTLFIALKGERFDGHNFTKDAIKNGAAAIVISKSRLNQFIDVEVPMVAVKDTKLALGDIAKIWRKKLDAKIIGITGSSGKTTVKDILAEILSKKYKVNKTESNNNNHIGVPLTILNTNEKHQVLVAELGTNHFGEITYTANILSPDYSLITNIGDSHLEFLKNREGVWKEKSFLFEETIRNGGKVFLNFDDPILKAKYLRKGNCISYGFSGRVDVQGKIKSYTEDGKPVIEITYKKKNYEFTLPIYGEQSAKNFLASCAVALEFGMSIAQIKNTVSRLKAPSGRLDVQRFKNFILIDDTYNANPDSTKAAIELVGRIKTFKKKILILGDMLELGKTSIKLHQRLKNVIVNSKVDEVYTVGSKMKHLYEKFDRTNLLAIHFTKREFFKSYIKHLNFNDSVILVKGSRGMRMEEFVSEIKNKSMS